MSDHYEIREGTYHYIEHFSAKGVYMRTLCASAYDARSTVAHYRANQRAAAERGQPVPEGHGVRAVTEIVTREVYDDA